MKSTSFLALSIFIVCSFFSCEEETIKYATDEAIYSTQLTIVDASGKNSVLLSIASNDSTALELYSKSSFQLIVNPTDSFQAESWVKPLVGTESFGGTPLAIKIGVLKENFTDKVERFRIVETEPHFVNPKASYVVRTYWTSRDGIFCERNCVHGMYVTTKYFMYECNPLQMHISDSWANGFYGDFLVLLNERAEDFELNSEYMALLVRAKLDGGTTYSWGGFNTSAE